MNCLFCEDKLWLCEKCEAPWPCGNNDGAGMNCPQCNPEAVFPPGYVSLARTPERKQH